jgi:hypothetical protein
MAAHTPPSALPNPFWVLQGSAARQLTCRVAQTPSQVWIVTLTLGHETMLSESYPDADGAIKRAIGLKDGLIDKGWTQVPSGSQFA